MLKKSFMLSFISAIVLAMAAPPVASALTIDELKAGLVLGVNAYPSVTVTSPTNTSIKITVTPDFYANGKWSYVLDWNRVRQAKGSVRVYLRSNPSERVLALESVDPSGSAKFSVNPATQYTVEFFANTGFAGTVLVRKSFTSVAAASNGQETSDIFDSNLFSPPSQTPLGLRSYGLGVGTGPHTNYLGKKVGPGIGSRVSSCQYQMGVAGFFAGGGLGQDSDFRSLACANVGKPFLYSIDYVDPSGKSIHWDHQGKFEFDPKVHAALLGYQPQPLASVPNSALDPVLYNRDYNAKCFYSVLHGKDVANTAPYLDGYDIGCGEFAGSSMNYSADRLANIYDQIRNSPGSSILLAPPSQTPLGLRSYGFGVGTGPQTNYLGTQIGPGIGSRVSSCQYQTGIAGYFASGGLGQDSDFRSLSCANVGKPFLYSIDYKDSSGQCIHWDHQGKFKFDCKIHAALLGYEPQVLASVPTSALDPVLYNRDYNAKCFYAVVHGVGATPYLDGYDIGCGEFAGSSMNYSPNTLTNIYDQVNSGRAARGY